MAPQNPDPLVLTSNVTNEDRSSSKKGFLNPDSEKPVVVRNNGRHNSIPSILQDEPSVQSIPSSNSVPFIASQRHLDDRRNKDAMLKPLAKDQAESEIRARWENAVDPDHVIVVSFKL